MRDCGDILKEEIHYEHRGYDICVRRLGYGNGRTWRTWWTGYVQLTFDSRAGPPEERIDVHGGLTFGGDLHGDGRYWIGFDYGHSGDEALALDDQVVAAEARRLVDQLIAWRRSPRGVIAAMRAKLLT